LQPRFEQIQRKKVFRLLAHPRFRAAFDFLLLRAAESPAIGELGQWWEHAQQLPHETLAAALPLQQSAVAGEPEPTTRAAATRKRKRRRKPAAGKSGTA
jgi:poly(A) polymerase